MQYEFRRVDSCNMCGFDGQRILGKRLNGHQGIRPTRKTGITTTVVRCERCGLVFSNPQPIPEAIEDHYEVEPENYWSDSGQQSARPQFEEQLRTFSRLHSGERVALDIGSGTGGNFHAMQAAGFEVWGLEPSAPFRRRAVASGVNEERLLGTPVEDAPFDPETFTFVSFSAVLEHLLDPSTALVRALQWLRPSGLIHIEVPSARWLTSRIVNAAYRLQGLDYVTNLSPMHVPFHLYEFTERAFAEHAQQHGYEVVSQQVLAGTQTYLPLPGLSKVMARTGTDMQLETWLRKP